MPPDVPRAPSEKTSSRPGRAGLWTSLALGAALLATGSLLLDARRAATKERAATEALGLAAAAARTQAETALLAERGHLAGALALAPGREVEAVRVGLSAVEPRLSTPAQIPVPALAGLAAAVQADRALATLGGHTSTIVAVAFSPDGARALTASADGTARSWDLTTGATLTTLKSPHGPITAASFSRDGTRALTGGPHHAAHVWDTASGNMLSTLAHPPYDPTRSPTESPGSPDSPDSAHPADSILATTFSPDGSRAATATAGGDVRLWDTATGTLVAARLEHRGQVVTLAFSPDGARLVTAGEDRTAQVWDTSTGARITSLEGHRRLVRAATFSPDGKTIATASWDDTARFWDPSTGKQLALLEGHAAPLHALSFAPDGSGLLTASADGTARHWTANGADSTPLRGHEASVDLAIFSPDSRLLLTAGHDGAARLWARGRVSIRQIATLRGHRGVLQTATFSPDGTRVLTGASDGTARLWDVRPRRPTRTLDWHGSPSGGYGAALAGTFLLEGYGSPLRLLRTTDGQVVTSVPTPGEPNAYPLALSEDGSRAVIHRDGAELRDLRTGKEIADLVASPSAAAVSVDGSRVAVSSYGGGVTLYEGQDGRLIATLPGDATRLAFSRNGAALVAAGSPSRVWDARDGHLIADLGDALCAAISDDASRVVTGGAKGEVLVLNAASGKPTATLATRGRVEGVAISPDGARVAAVTRDGVIALWTAEGKLVSERASGGAFVIAVTFSRDGTLLATGGDRVAELWDAATGEPVVSFPGHPFPVVQLGFSPDGRELTALDNDGHAHVYPASAAEFVAQARALLKLQPATTTPTIPGPLGRVAQPSAEGAPCERDESALCEDGRHACISERCVNPCGAGKVLSGGTDCVEVDCTSDADCRSGSRCVESTCKPWRR